VSTHLEKVLRVYQLGFCDDILFFYISVVFVSSFSSKNVRESKFILKELLRIY
jgi:hypothetical protein